MSQGPVSGCTNFSTWRCLFVGRRTPTCVFCSRDMHLFVEIWPTGIWRFQEVRSPGHQPTQQNRGLVNCSLVSTLSRGPSPFTGCWVFSAIISILSIVRVREPSIRSIRSTIRVKSSLKLQISKLDSAYLLEMDWDGTN